MTDQPAAAAINSPAAPAINSPAAPAINSPAAPAINFSERFAAWERREVPPQLDAQFRLAAELRALMGSLNLTTAPVEALDELAVEVRRLREQIAHHPRQPKLTMSEMVARLASGQMPPGGAETFAHFDHSAFMGAANPIAPPMKLSLRDGRITGTVRFSDLYEGPPGHVHGGFVAAVLDEVLGASQASTNSPGMTARLEVTYKAPTPLHTDLVATGWVEKVEGRKIFAVGEVRNGEQVTAIAHGLFVSFDFTRLVPGD